MKRRATENKKREIIKNRTKEGKITTEFFGSKMQSYEHQIEVCKINIIHIGSEGIPEITADEPDNILTEMAKLAGEKSS